MSYAFNSFNKETMARAKGSNLRISLKKSVEVARAIRGKRLDLAIEYLEGVIAQKKVVPYIRYKQEMAHKKGKGIAVGGYPVLVAKEFLKLLESAKKNASEQEIGEKLYILSASARKGPSRYKPGRYFGRKMKMTHLEVIVGIREKDLKKEAKKEKVKKEASKK